MGSAKLIFVTSREDLVWRAFSYHPFWYVSKKQQHSTLTEALEAFCRSVESRYKSVEINGDVMDICDMKYVEKQGHYVVIKGDKMEKKIRGNIGDFEEILKPYCFIRTHVGYLVNPEYISSIAKENVLLDNGETVPVSRRNFQHTKEMLEKYQKGIVYR